jgi:hypothetical protein
MTRRARKLAETLDNVRGLGHGIRMTPSLDPVISEVRAALARVDMTQAELAKVTGRSQTYWSRRLRGGLPLNVTDLALISRITGVPVADLMRGAA